MNSSVTKRVQDHRVYLNIQIVNPETATTSILASISQVLQSPLLDCPKNYMMMMTRFSAPGRSIPMFYFETQRFPNTDINKGIYTVTIGYNGNYTAPVHLKWIPQTFLPPNSSAFSALNVNQDPSDIYYYNYSYQNLADMVTNALRTALLDAAGFLPVGVFDSYMIYDASTGLFSLLGSQIMYHSSDPKDPLNVQIWFNTPLQNFFTAFENVHNGFNLPSGLDELILIKNNLNNSPATQSGFNPNIPPDYYQIQSEFNSDDNAESLTRIIITSNGMGGVVPQAEVDSSIAAGTYQNILTDLVPAASVSNGSYRSKIQYYNQGEFYRRNLTQSSPLYNIDLQFWWQGVRSCGTRNFRPLSIAPGNSLSLLVIYEEQPNAIKVIN